MKGEMSKFGLGLANREQSRREQDHRRERCNKLAGRAIERSRA